MWPVTREYDPVFCRIEKDGVTGVPELHSAMNDIEAITNRLVFPRGHRHESDGALDITNRTVYDAYEGALARRLEPDGSSSERLPQSYSSRYS